MKKLDPNLVFVFGAVVFFIAVLLYTEHHFPNDGQIFQVIAGILAGTATVFLSAARHAFGIPDAKDDPNAQTVQTTVQTTQTVTAPPPVPPTTT